MKNITMDDLIKHKHWILIGGILLIIYVKIVGVVFFIVVIFSLLALYFYFKAKQKQQENQSKSKV